MNYSTGKLRNKNYYHLAHQGSTDLTHPAMKVLLKLFQDSEKVLDMGCGEGTRLNTLLKATKLNGKQLIGIDASKIAIDSARKQYPAIKFLVGDLEELPFKDNSFDLLYSAYVFEHLIHPEKVLNEAKRVLKSSGALVIIAPNFGSPNRRSPNSEESKLVKLLSGFVNDFSLLFANDSLNWVIVTPKTDIYTTDADTTVEPYILSLIKYCENLGFKVQYFSSNWEVDKFSMFQLVFKILGNIGIYPFRYWGPHLSMVMQK